MKALLSLLFCALCLLGCGSSSSDDSPMNFGTVPASSVSSDSGALKIDLLSAPDATPTRGVNSLRFVVTHVADGTPATGLDLDVTPWMPAMGHGASVKPTVTPEAEPGVYTATNVSLFMPGLWEIRTTIGGSMSDHVTPQFEIE